METKVVIIILLAALLHAPRTGAAAPGAAPGPQTPVATASAATTPAGIPPANLDRIVTLFNNGIALMEQYRPADAVKAFEEVVQLAPGWTKGRLNLAIALLNAQSEESYARAEIELKRVTAADPDNPYGHYALGMLLKHLDRFDEAKVQFQRVLQIDPEDGDAHYQLGALLADKDPEAARRHFEKTLQKIPHHESACYRLQKLLRQAGEAEKAQELLQRFQALKKSGAGVFAGTKYGEMGRYAEVVRAFGEQPPASAADVPPAYTDTAQEAGLLFAARGNPGWPGQRLPGTAAGAAAFGPGVAVADVDGDGDLDVYVTGVGPDAAGTLYRNAAGRFSADPGAGVDGHDAIGAYFGDYDADGDPDLYLTRAGANRLYRNEGNGRFTDVTNASGTSGGAYLSLGAAWADADHDGDLDLYVANFAALGSATAAGGGAPNTLWRNNGDGSFTDVAPGAGIDGGQAASTGVLFFDADGDRDLDLYLINHGSPNRVFFNDRIGRYTDATSRFPNLADGGPGLGALLADMDENGLEDVLLLRGPKPPRLFLQLGRGHFSADPAFAAVARDLVGAVSGLSGDFDLDGDLDLVLLGAGSSSGVRHRILMNRGGGRFSAPTPFGEERNSPDARGAVAADFDGDGSLELLVARAGSRPELWWAPPAKGRRWLEVIPAKAAGAPPRWAAPGAVGTLVEVKTGQRLQVARISSAAGYLGGLPRRAHFGLGKYGKADYVRLSWPDAVLQSELEVSAGQHWRITKVVRKPSSCPVLFAWNGKRFAFVTDFLGVGGIGFFIAPGEYAPPDPTEAVRLPPEIIAAQRGRYLLRVAQPLEEVTYLDELHLLAYDHPARLELYPDERLASTPPLPTGQPFAFGEKIFPVEAHNDRGEDVRSRILEIDRRYAEPPVDPRFVGYARDHWIELDFGDQLRILDPQAHLILGLYGWVEYTYSHVNYAAYQAGLRMHPPSIEVPDLKQGWRVAMPEVGYPAGLPRMMTVDVSSAPIRESGRLRIRTNMEIFWDQIFVAEDVAVPELRTHILRPAVAELRSVGYPREYSPDGSLPTLYDYERIDHGVPFNNFTGNLTRFGDVRILLEKADDRPVIMGRGEEIAFEFDSTELPRLPAGWARTLVLHADGYTKDMDLYTAFPDTVEPHPFHAMANYPPVEVAPQAESWYEYQRRYNTRHVMGR